MTFDSALTEILDEFQDVYGLEVTAVSFEAFKEVLAGCTPQELSFAAVEHLRESRFAPRPAELLAIIRGKRAVEIKAEKNQEFWQRTRDAERTKCERGFKRPEGVSVLDHLDALIRQGMTREQAVEEICG